MADSPSPDASPDLEKLSDVPFGPVDTTPSEAASCGKTHPRLQLVVGARPVSGYELVEQLGQGGFGEVWKARGPGGFAVALKFIQLGHQASRVETRALELLKGIAHANLVGLFAAWQQNGFLILAMELAQGTLLDRLREFQDAGKVGIPLEELREAMSEAAKGIDYLNQLGIQHRDIKPQNLLRVGGSIKVADFGLAKLLEHTVVSNSGAMTPAYAPPEFFNGQTSSQSDQYSLAVSYCQLRGGELPFRGTAAQVMAGHLLNPPDLSMLPEPERRVVVQALAKNPSERFPNCRSFVEAVATACEGVPPLDLTTAATWPSTSSEPRVGTPDSPEPAAGTPTSPDPKWQPRPRGARRLGIAAGVLLILGAGYSWWTGIRQAAIPAAPDTTPLEWTNSIGMKLIRIPAGKFPMGSPPDERGRFDNEGPLHDVEITQPFYLGKCEVSVGQFQHFVRDAGYKTYAEQNNHGGWGYNAQTKKFEGPTPRYSWKNVGWEQSDEYPVVNVTWNDAQAFCRWLSMKEGRVYRLPTEAEWEYSCRGRSRTRYWSGDDAETLAEVGNVADATAREQFPSWDTILGRDGYVFTAPVGKFRSNPFGLNDMHGNVWEWCGDWFDKDYYQDSPVQDPLGPRTGSHRVIRGGSFLLTRRYCRAAVRFWFDPDYRAGDLGFRVLCARNDIQQ